MPKWQVFAIFFCTIMPAAVVMGMAFIREWRNHHGDSGKDVPVPKKSFHLTMWHVHDFVNKHRRPIDQNRSNEQTDPCGNIGHRQWQKQAGKNVCRDNWNGEIEPIQLYVRFKKIFYNHPSFWIKTFVIISLNDRWCLEMRCFVWLIHRQSEWPRVIGSMPNHKLLYVAFGAESSSAVVLDWTPSIQSHILLFLILHKNSNVKRVISTVSNFASRLTRIQLTLAAKYCSQLLTNLEKRQNLH